MDINSIFKVNKDSIDQKRDLSTVLIIMIRFIFLYIKYIVNYFSNNLQINLINLNKTY